MIKYNSRVLEAILFLLLFLIMIALFYIFTIQNTHRIQLQNNAYAEDAAKQIAVHMDEQFKSSLAVIEAYAFFLNRTLKEPVVTREMIQEMEDASPFDAVVFTTADGESRTCRDITENSRDKRFYTEGMRGNSGMYIMHSNIFDKPVLSFYTPVYFGGKIIGVLHGSILSRAFLLKFLQASYFGEQAELLLCRADGDILVSSLPENNERIVPYLLQSRLVEPGVGEEIEKVFSEGASRTFIGSSNDASANISIIKLPQFGYILVQVFPASISRNMIAQANKAGIELELSLFALFAAVAAYLLIRARIQKKSLEKRNRDLAMINKGMNIIFSSRYLLGNLETGKCVYVGGPDDASKDSGNWDSYEDALKAQLNKLALEKERREFKYVFARDNLFNEFKKHDTVSFACKINSGDQETWENIIGICLNRVDGKPCEFLVAHQNITETKRRELRAQSKIADMDRKERQYQLALTANAFATYEFNVSKDLLGNDIIQNQNGAGKSLVEGAGFVLPCRASDFLASWAKRILPESLHEYESKTDISWLLAQYGEGIQETELDFWMQDLDGNEQCIRQSFYLAANDLTGDIMAMTVMRDITSQVIKRRAQTKALQDALLVAQHANAAKTTFLSNMSHDIRTPMNAIIGFATIASNHLDNINQVRECLRKVLSSSNHLLSLINDILDMSRIESGKMQVKEQPCNISELMHNVVTIIQPQVKAKQMNFCVDTCDILNENVITDPLKLNQVFINLLGNAVKYTPAGGSITFRMTQKPNSDLEYGEYVFEVGDNGIGMTQEFVKHIFEPFTRATTTTQSGIQGTGLGMAITKNIIEMLNGGIEVETEPGKGSLFTVTLRFRLQEEEQLALNLDCLAGKKALIIDDDFHICDGVSKMLKLLGLVPEWTTSGREALYRAQLAEDDGEPYSLFMIDWHMPEMNGMNTAKKLREIVGSKAAIIILTAYEWTEIEEEARGIDISAFCVKPLFMSDLKNALRLICENADQEDDEEGPAVKFNDARILLVDDVEMNREVAEFILTESGFQVETAPDGSDAVEMVANSPENYYDAVLMDVQMPTMNGYEATRAIRNMDRGDVKTMPILAMTANALEEDRANALKCGMNDHIAKPIDIKIFFEILGKYLQRS